MPSSCCAVCSILIPCETLVGEKQARTAEAVLCAHLCFVFDQRCIGETFVLLRKVRTRNENTIQKGVCAQFITPRRRLVRKGIWSTRKRPKNTSPGHQPGTWESGLFMLAKKLDCASTSERSVHNTQRARPLSNELLVWKSFYSKRVQVRDTTKCTTRKNPRLKMIWIPHDEHDEVLWFCSVT